MNILSETKSFRSTLPLWAPLLALFLLFFYGNAAFAVSKLLKPGSDEEAIAYYERISGELAYQVDGSNLSDLVDYLGYKGLSGRGLEFIDPAGLSPITPEAFEHLRTMVEDPDAFAQNFSLDDLIDTPILATRYLAPRIVDISGTPPYEAGWRKLVRLKTRSGSEADAAGVASAFIVFDYLRAQDDPTPFPDMDSADERASAIIQVLLVPRPDHETLTDGVYFLLFDGMTTGYASTRFVLGNFDLPPDPAPDPEADGKFYVPTACARCHGDVGKARKVGGAFPSAKLNFLDTDYWSDRIGADDFFAEAGALHGVLFGGGGDISSVQFSAAFEAVRVLNSEIAEQNEEAPLQGNEPNYHVLGVQKWLEIHADSDAPAPPIERSLGEEDDHWSSQYPEDEPLLERLSRHCYRCHNTIDFNVFLKPRFAGVAKAGSAQIRFGFMPIGHDLRSHGPDEVEALMEGLEKLLAQQRR
jgi:hypothetical protein